MRTQRRGRAENVWAAIAQIMEQLLVHTHRHREPMKTLMELGQRG